VKSEISTLLTDIKEQILYLYELGAENLCVSCRKFPLMQIPKPQSLKSEISQERLERFVPTDFEPAGTRNGENRKLQAPRTTLQAESA
jgi:hypothetical protein